VDNNTFWKFFGKNTGIYLPGFMYNPPFVLLFIGSPLIFCLMLQLNYLFQDTVTWPHFWFCRGAWLIVCYPFHVKLLLICPVFMCY